MIWKKKSNAGIVSSVSKASSVSIIYSKLCYSTVRVSNAQYCKNANNVSTGESIVKDDFQSVLRSFSTLMFMNIMNLTRWNANRCYSLQNTYLIFEAFQIIFPTASLIFTAAKLFHQVIWQRTKHKASTASALFITAVILKLWISFI